MSERAVMMLGVSRPWIEEQKAKILKNIAQKRAIYHRPRIPVEGKRVILVDDGVATGASMFLAAKSLKDAGAKEVIVVVPVAPPDAIALLKQAADKVIVGQVPPDFMAVGQYYKDFHQLEDDEVVELLQKAQGL
jgi:predicted phosphoribosyltransferase